LLALAWRASLLSEGAGDMMKKYRYVDGFSGIHNESEHACLAEQS
jgi:hypothetical protein